MMKKKCLLLFAMLLAGCQKQPTTPSEVEVCQCFLNEGTGSRYKERSASLDEELAEKVLSLYDSLLSYDGDKKDVSDYDGNEHLEEYQCHWEWDVEERIYLSSDKSNPYIFYSEGGFGTKEGRLWYISALDDEEMERIVLSLQESFSLLLEDVPEVEA